MQGYANTPYLEKSRSSPKNATKIGVFREYFTMKSQQTYERLSAFDYDDEKIPAYKDLHIEGPFRYQDNSVYLGQFKDNKKHGRGKCAYKNGGLYEGEWKDD